MRQSHVHNWRHPREGNKAIEVPVLQRRGTSGLTSREKSAGFTLLLEPHLDAVYNYARWLARNDNDAEDVAHDVCNAIKLSQFTAVKMSHPWRVVSSLFAEILTV